MAVEQLTRPTIADAPPSRPPPRAALVPTSAGPRWLQGGTIPSLDGLRALSIGMVLLGHASLTWDRAPTGHAGPLVRLGSIGVDLFFVISGFLITLLLLRERRRSGRIALGAFYVRRFWRILPAYLAFLTVLAIFTCGSAVQLTPRDWVGACTYTVNFLPGTSWPVGHLWSLAVEEHFYLAWPLLLLVLGPGRACALAAGYVVLAPLVRLLLWRLGSPSLDIDYCTPARIDTIAVGCLLAYLLDRASARQALLWPSRSRAAVLFLLLAGCLVLSNTVLHASGLYQVTIRRTVDAVCFAALVWTSMAHADGILGRILNTRLLVIAGQLSYGIYLWQQPLLNPHMDAWPCRWPTNIVLALGLAVLSFTLIERPFLRLRERRGWGGVRGPSPVVRGQRQASAVSLTTAHGPQTTDSPAAAARTCGNTAG